MKFNVKRGEVTTGDLFLIFTEEQMKKGSSKYLKEITSKIKKGQFSGKPAQKTTLHLDKIRLHLLGLGEEKELTKETLRKAGGSIANEALCLKIPDFTVLSDTPKISPADSAEAITDGIILGSYRFDRYKTVKKDIIKLNNVTILTNSKDKKVEDSVKYSQITCEATNYVRDLQTENADVATPTYLEKQARDIAKKHKLKIKVLDEKALKKLGAGLILAVGIGSKYPSRIIILEYKGNPKSKDTTAVVGKGITFDTGGLNLKPTNYIETMKCDMSGAASVLGLMKSASQLKLKKNIIGVLSVPEIPAT